MCDSECSPGLREGQTTFLRMQSAPLVKMMITTYNPSAECTTPRGSQITQMGIQNKRDYAKWHHYLFSLVTRTEDKSLKKMQSPLVGISVWPPDKKALQGN